MSVDVDSLTQRIWQDSGTPAVEKHERCVLARICREILGSHYMMSAITSLQRTQQRALKHKASERPDPDEKHIGLRMSAVTENLVFQEYVTE